MQVVSKKKYSGEIAIVGIGCKFPGEIVDLDSFWKAVCEKKETAGKIPPARWNWKDFYSPDNSTIAKSFFLNASFLTQPIDEFEPLFFGMSPKEAVQCDPQQRILLETAWEAMEEGGLVPAKYAGKKVGVYVGVFATDWLVMQSGPYASEGNVDTNFLATTASTTMLAARLSYVFDFTGPSLALDTACSSSLTAIYLACQSLRNGESDLGMAGGVNVILAPQGGIIIAKARFLSPDGKSKSFDAAADGYGRGEGCGIVMLKRLEDALEDGDKIHAVIGGIGINQDGHNEGITVPSAAAQEKLIREVAEQANVSLSDISYVEAHGTGTPVGDPLEAQAISNTIGKSRPKDDPVIIGSIKANIGHIEAGAGVAGLIKACLCIKHRAVPPQANLKEPNPNIPFEDLNLRLIKDETVPLLSTAEDLYVAVNSFGYGGSNACALLRAPRKNEIMEEVNTQTVHMPSDSYILSLSTKQQPSLKLMAEKYATFIKGEKSPPIGDICYSVGKHRSYFQKHLVVFGQSKEEIARNLLDFIEEKPNSDVIIGNQQIKTQTQPAFVFSGMGPQWWGMGQWLLRHGPKEGIKIAEEIDLYFTELSGWSILNELKKTEAESRIHETSVAQPGIFTVQVCLAEVLKLYGIRPAAIVGHSVGEAAAAYVAGALSLKDATKVIYNRSRLQQKFAGQGTMLAVGLPPSTSAELIGHYEGDVAVAAINSPRSYTLSGSKENLEKIAVELEKRNEFHRFLKVELAYHNPIMTQIRDEFEDAVEGIEPRIPTTPLYSSVTGHICDDTFFHDANYWYRNLRQTVLFAEAISTMIHDSYSLFLEIGPHPVLTPSIKECASTLNVSIGNAYTLHRAEPESKALAKTLSSLSAVGLEIDWDMIVQGKHVDLPYYAWDKAKYWSENKHSQQIREGKRVNPVLGNVDWSASRGWLSELNVNTMPWLQDHKIEGMMVLPGAAYVEAAIAAHAQLAINAPKEMQEPTIIENLQLKKAMIIDEKFYPYVTWSVDELTARLLVYGRTENDSPNWDLYGSALLRRTAPWGGEDLEDLDQLKAKITEQIDVSFFYNQLKECGLEYGSAFQTITELHYGDGIALARLQLSESEQDKVDDYYVHPTLLDGAFQLFGLLGAKDKTLADATFVPVGIERIMYYGKHESELYAYALNFRKDDDLFVGDVNLYNAKGEPVVKVKGLAVKELATEKQKEAKRARWLYHYEWKEAEALTLLGEIARVAIITDSGMAVSPVIEELEMQGVTVYQGILGDCFGQKSDLIYNIRPDSEEDYREFFSFIDLHKCRAVVYLRSEVTDKNDQIGLTLVKEILTLSKGLPALEEKDVTENLRFVIITNGAEKIQEHEKIENLNQSSLRGFVRVFSLERPELGMKMVDINADISTIKPDVLAAEILCVDMEDEVAIRADKRFVARLMPLKNEEETNFVPLEEAGENVGFRLMPGRSGLLDQIHYEAYERQKTPPGHIELEIITSSLNFKDVLKVMKLLPRSVVKHTFHQDGLGMEASARVVAVGKGAEEAGYYVGDRLVVSIRNCLTSHVIVPVKGLFAVHLDAQSMIREAERYSLTDVEVEGLHTGTEIPNAEASTMPTVFSTAYYTLITLADLKEGQTILIHAASGGLGLAAIQIAKLRKARIFATAGNDKKRQYLKDLGCEYVWNSRNLEFVDGVKEVTNGRGVDVVLNSLSGELLQASLSLVAPFGRFFEVGKRDIVEEKWLPMQAFNDNIGFFSMDLDRMLAQRPDEIIRMLIEVTRHILNGRIIMPPCSIYPAAKSIDAFREMASAQHIGKIVIDFSDRKDVMVRAVPKKISAVSPQGAYVITGAYGGMGLQLVQWLVGLGAKHLILVGRSLKEDDENIQSAINILKQNDIHIYQMQADVSDFKSIKPAIDKATKLDVPLKGVFHCAAVIDDGVIENLDDDRLTSVMLPKAQGAWNLHELTKDIELDHFVLFSSATNLLGNIGQAAYVSANFFLDALAKYRKEQGLPALAIEWGAIEGGSMFQKDSQAAKNFEAIGVTAIPVKEALSTISLLWKQEEPCVGVLDIDWSKWFAVFPISRSVGRFQELLTLGNSSFEQTEALRQLNALPVEERLSFVVQNLLGILTKTLQIPPESIDGNTRLTELGIDSLVGVELQIAISNTLGCEISLLQLMKEENIQDVGKVLLRKLKVPFESNESLVIDTDGKVEEDQTQLIEANSENKAG